MGNLYHNCKSYHDNGSTKDEPPAWGCTDHASDHQTKAYPCYAHGWPWVKHNVQQQGQMFIQNINRIVIKPNVMIGQILYCTTDCIPVDLSFGENYPTNTQVWNRLRHRNDCQQKGVIWVTYRCYNSNPYLVRDISHQEVKSSVPPHAWFLPTTNWMQPETVAKSKAATPWGVVEVEPNHSWWWPFTSPTNSKEAWISLVCTAAIDACKQSKNPVV